MKTLDSPRNPLMLFILISLCSTHVKGMEGDPADPDICVPPIIYQSSFVGYLPLRPIKVQNWTKANEAVMNQPMDHMQHMNMPMNDPKNKPMNNMQHMNMPMGK